MASSSSACALSKRDIIELPIALDRRIATLSLLAALEDEMAARREKGLEGWLASLVDGLAPALGPTLSGLRICGRLPASVITGQRRILLGLALEELLRAAWRLRDDNPAFTLHLALALERGSLRVAVIGDEPIGQDRDAAHPSLPAPPRFGIARALVAKLGGAFTAAPIIAGFCAVISVPVDGKGAEAGAIQASA